jgi:hypothetical protein
MYNSNAMNVGSSARTTALRREMRVPINRGSARRL